MPRQPLSRRPLIREPIAVVTSRLRRRNDRLECRLDGADFRAALSEARRSAEHTTIRELMREVNAPMREACSRL